MERKRKPIDLAPRAEVKPTRPGTKAHDLVRLLRRPNGATFDQMASHLSKKGSPVKPNAVRSWLQYDVHKLHGYGIKSEHDAKGQLRCKLVEPDKQAAA